MDIEVFGEKHRFRTNLDSETAKRIQDHLKREFSKVCEDSNIYRTGTEKVIAMTAVALNIAKEKIELERENSELRRQFESRTEHLLEILRKELEGTVRAG